MKKLLAVSRVLAVSGLVCGITVGALAQSTSFPGQITAQRMPGTGSQPGQIEGSEGLQGMAGAEGGLTVALTTTLTSRSHQIGAGASALNLEGTSCTAPNKMISGACHPFYNPSVTIINQFPNIALNTWRCGFKNNTASTVTVWI